MTLREIFARNLRYWRAQRGLSQEQLALRTKISRGYMSDLEREAHSASLDMVERIARVLAVEPAQLLDKSKPQKG